MGDLGRGQSVAATWFASSWVAAITCTLDSAPSCALRAACLFVMRLAHSAVGAKSLLANKLIVFQSDLITIGQLVFSNVPYGE